MTSSHAHQTILDVLTAADPAAVALLADGRAPVSYGALVAHAAEIRAYVRGLGLARNDRVGIVLPEGPELASALLTLASAVTTAPLNPRLHDRELEFAVKDFGLRAVIVGASAASDLTREVARRCEVPVLELAVAPTAPAGVFALRGPRVGPPSVDAAATPGDLALVLHTSGTTARPKIVPLPHAKICETAHNIARRLALSPADRCVNIMPMFHVHGILNVLLSSMTAGASVACAPEFDASRFFAHLEAFRPTWYSAVPTLHQAILAHAARHADIADAAAAAARLRLVRSSSARLPTPVLEELERVFRAPVIESYGMTEVDQIACNPLPPARQKPGSVGLPGGPEVRIASLDGELLPAGQIGEVVVRGSNVIDRYEASAEVNAHAFAHGFFHTGDQGYFDEDGYLFLTGRIKEIINRGGEKISPLEIEEVLLAHPAVAEVVVGPVPHDQLGEDILAAVVPRAGHAPTGFELRTWATARLSSFKVPAHVAIVAALPKGPTGKLQRLRLADALAHELAAATAPDSGDVATPLQAAIRDVWERVLEIRPIQLHDDYNALGGTSLLAGRLFVELGRRFARPIPASVMLASRTIAEMAEHLEEAGWGDLE